MAKFLYGYHHYEIIGFFMKEGTHTYLIDTYVQSDILYFACNPSNMRNYEAGNTGTYSSNFYIKLKSVDLTGLKMTLNKSKIHKFNLNSCVYNFSYIYTSFHVNYSRIKPVTHGERMATTFSLITYFV